MSATITISLSDADYERLRKAAERANISPEALAADAIAEKYSMEEARKKLASNSERAWEDPAIAIMRANGHLADTCSYPLPPAADLPPYGSPEYKRLLEEIGQELSDAVEQSGKSILDLIERR